MARQPADTRERILDAAFRLFYRKGFSRVSVDAVAELTGVTKRTIYYHFDSKDQIVAAMIEVQHLHLMKQYQSWLDPSSTTASEIVDRLFSKLRAWVDGPDWLGSGFSRIAAELADLRGHPARMAAHRHKAQVEDWLAERFTEAGVQEPGALACQIMILIEGGMSLALIHNDATYIENAMRAAKSLVENQGGSTSARIRADSVLGARRLAALSARQSFGQAAANNRHGELSISVPSPKSATNLELPRSTPKNGKVGQWITS